MILSGATCFFYRHLTYLTSRECVLFQGPLRRIEGNDAFRAKKSTNSESAMCHFDACICPVGGLDLTVQCPPRKKKKKKKAEKARADATLRSRVDVLARPPASDGLDRKRLTSRERRERCTTSASLSFVRDRAITAVDITTSS